MPKTIHCPAGERTVLVRNIAARGLARTFTLTAPGATGEVEVISSALPFFLLKGSQKLNFKSGMKVPRKFFDASFELAITPSADIELTLQ